VGEAVGFGVVGGVVDGDAGCAVRGDDFVEGLEEGFVDVLYVGDDFVPVAGGFEGLGVVVADDGYFFAVPGDEEGALPGEAAVEDEGRTGSAASVVSRTKVSQVSNPVL